MNRNTCSYSEFWQSTSSSMGNMFKMEDMGAFQLWQWLLIFNYPWCSRLGEKEWQCNLFLILECAVYIWSRLNIFIMFIFCTEYPLPRATDNYYPEESALPRGIWAPGKLIYYLPFNRNHLWRTGIRLCWRYLMLLKEVKFLSYLILYIMAHKK